MPTRSWIRSLFARPVTRTIRKAPPRTDLWVEALEDRTVPSRFSLTGLLDAGSVAAPAQAHLAAGANASIFVPTVLPTSFPPTVHVFPTPHSATASPQSASGNSPPISIPYNGGPLLTHVQVQAMYYNDPITLGLQSQLDGFFTDIVQSKWVTQMLANFSVPNYNIGAGSFLGDDNTGLPVPQGDPFGPTIPSQLVSEIASGRLAAPPML